MESPDGSVVYYIKNEGKDRESSSASLWKIPVQGGDETRVLDSITQRAVTVIKEGIYFVPPHNPGSPRVIQFLDFATGKIETITTIEMPVIASMSVSPDRNVILYSQVDELGSDLMLVENFR